MSNIEVYCVPIGTHSSQKAYAGFLGLVVNRLNKDILTSQIGNEPAYL